MICWWNLQGTRNQCDLDYTFFSNSTVDNVKDSSGQQLCVSALGCVSNREHNREREKERGLLKRQREKDSIGTLSWQSAKKHSEVEYCRGELSLPLSLFLSGPGCDCSCNQAHCINWMEVVILQKPQLNAEAQSWGEQSIVLGRAEYNGREVWISIDTIQMQMFFVFFVWVLYKSDPPPKKRICQKQNKIESRLLPPGRKMLMCQTNQNNRSEML